MSTKNIKPLGNRILVKRAEAQATKGGIFLPDTAQERPKQGEVVAVGPGKMDEEGKLIPTEVREGDQVLFSSYSGTEVKSGGSDSEYLVMSEDDILAVIEG